MPIGICTKNEGENEVIIVCVIRTIQKISKPEGVLEDMPHSLMEYL
jgi:hypothetical protein